MVPRSNLTPTCSSVLALPLFIYTFCLNVLPPTKIYTLSLHDALPIYPPSHARFSGCWLHVEPDRTNVQATRPSVISAEPPDRKSTRLNSSHTVTSYAVFCLQKKKRPCRAACPSRPPLLLIGAVSVTFA